MPRIFSCYCVFFVYLLHGVILQGFLCFHIFEIMLFFILYGIDLVFVWFSYYVVIQILPEKKLVVGG